MRVFLDANILFSAAQSQSRMRAFLERLFDRAECLTNAYAAEEARRNLAVKFPAGLPHRSCPLMITNQWSPSNSGGRVFQTSHWWIFIGPAQFQP